MSSLQALVGSSAECSGGNSISQFVKQLDRTGAVEQDLFRPGGPSEEHFGPIVRERPGRLAEFDDRQFVDEFLSPGQVEPRFADGFNKFEGPAFHTALEAELGREGPAGVMAKNDWAADFENFHHAEPPHNDVEFEAAFNRALQHVPEAWRDEFMQSGPMLERQEFERAFAAHHNTDLESAFSREFAAVQDTLAQRKGKEPMTLGLDSKEEISWEDEFAREFTGKDMDLKNMGELFKQFDMGSDAVRDWEKDYEDFEFNGQEAEEIDPDPVTAPCAPYVFESNNPYINHPNPLAEGQRLLEAGGSLSEAALAFEAAVQREPENSDAWASLGITQAENEKEGPAIAALQRSVQIDPKNLRALMALAVSYTNEGQELQAYATLERWLATQYPSIASLNAPSPALVDRSDIHARVADLFLEAARQGPSASIASLSEPIDPDVQIGLGVLFYNSSDYSKAIDCFTSALSSRPNDYLLWNRLGATLANSGRSEEAIDAYYKALELKPSFVRGRYNLGVSCINVGCYKEAAEHLLGALAMHGRGEENVSGNLWETLRRAFILMERRDLAEKAGKDTDVEAFRNEFEF